MPLASEAEIKDVESLLRQHDGHDLRMEDRIVLLDDLGHADGNQSSIVATEDRRAKGLTGAVGDIQPREENRDSHLIVIPEVSLLPIDRSGEPGRILDVDQWKFHGCVLRGSTRILGKREKTDSLRIAAVYSAVKQFSLS